MGLINPFMVKQTFAAADLSLEAKAGKSLLVLDIRVFNPVANFATIKIDKTTVGYFRVGGNLGNHLGLPVGSTGHSHALKIAAADGALTEDHAVTDALGVSQASVAIFSSVSALTEVANFVRHGTVPNGGYQTILEYLRKLGHFNGYPLEPGQTMTISGVNQAGCLQQIVYAEFDAADMKRTMPNGSEASEYLFINYGRTAAVITTSVSTIYDTMQSAREFPDFPFDKDVPAKTEITLLGLLGSDIVDDRGSNDTMQSTYLKLVRERVTLFDDDNNGLFHRGIIGNTDGAAQIARGVSQIGNLSDVDMKPPLMFENGLVFSAGEELGIYLTTVAGASQSATDLAVADTEIALIEKVKKVG